MGISVFPAAGGGVTQKVQNFTSTGTFTVPSNCTAVKVFAVGAGGGGGSYYSGGTAPWGAAGGGGGGEVIEVDILVTAGASYTVTIGAGGAGGVDSSAGVGGDTTFGALLTAKGGGSGAGWRNSAATLHAGTSRGTGGGGIGRMSGTNAWWGGAGGGAGGSAYLSGYLTGATGVDGLGGGTNFGYYPLSYSTNFHQMYSSGRGGHGLNVGKDNTSGTLPNISNNTNVNTFVFAGLGIDGYGCGGPGGGYINSVARTNNFSQGVLAVGGGGGSENGNSGAANTGNGGGGASTYAGNANGGTGGSGFLRVTYWS